jgi:hypothetical protein
MNAMEEAFEKAGFRKEAEKSVVKREQKEKEESERVSQGVRRYTKKVDFEAIKKFKPFDDRWKDPKKQKFLIHLLFSYMPFNIAYYPWTDSELRDKKCCICGQSLISVQFVLNNQEKFFDLSINQLRRSISGVPIKYREEFEKEFGNYVMAVVSSKSSASFCTPCFKTFCEWVEMMLLRGNRQILHIAQRRELESFLTNEQLIEHDIISKEKDPVERKIKMGAFWEKIRKFKEKILSK